MYCLKCGKETKDEQVFCEHCLEVMDRYPIKPGTPVQLPHRQSAAAPKKTSRRKILSAEEQIQQLRALVRALLVCLLAVSLMLGFFVWKHLQPETEEQPQKEIGQNYTVDSTTEDKD